MTQSEMVSAAEGYTTLWLFSSLVSIACAAGFAETPEHHGLLAGAIGLLILAVISWRRKIRILKDAERARILGE
jgi:hypothetical protein